MDRKPGNLGLAASVPVMSCHTAQGTVGLPPQPVSLGALPRSPRKSVKEPPSTATCSWRGFQDRRESCSFFSG